MYKSETTSTESATNASSSQHPEIERTYMASDTSTRLVKKKKTSTKALVKRLLGVVADSVHSDAIHTKIEENHQNKEKKAVLSPEKANEDIVNEESNDVSNHLLLDSVYVASTLSFSKE
ncbi:unnamed protein product [Lactuca virosa]|uniref:Uncharacterized protein n=1 Tax=Lactuca virosa TaxID=75947 RepID=A0AAU9LRB5_9ASTR|nr:unnamed protein product [Lactuca virosa]